MKIFYSILFLLMLLSKVSAQEPDEVRQDTEQKNTPQTVDTTKVRVSIKFLRSDMLSFDSIPFDTLLENVHVQNTIYQKEISASYLGNIGLAAKSNNFFQQRRSNDDFLLDGVVYNFIHKEDILYYRTNHPYSNIAYNSSSSKNVDLQSIRFLHTQNVNKKLNAGLLLNLHGSNGVYQKQKSSANALSLFSSYQNDYYSFNTVVSYNTLKNQENGGISNDTLFENDKDKGAVYPINLSDANTEIRNTYFFLAQRFNLAGLRNLVDKDKKDSVRRFSGIGLLHTLELDRNKRRYTDVASSLASVDRFYKQFNNDSIKTNDSLYFFRLQNSLELLLGKQNPNEPPILVRAGIKSLYDKFKYSERLDTLFPVDGGINDTSVVTRTFRDSYNNLAFTGGISLGIKSFFLLNANADYYFTGYKAGDLYLHGKLSNRFSRSPGSPSFNILMDISRYKPGYFYDQYFSNHYSWNNGFDPVKDVHAGFEFNWPAINFNADFNYSLLSEAVYFDSIAFPTQSPKEVSILEASASKGFKAGIFHSKIKGILQVTSDDRVVPLPLISAYNSSYIELRLFNKVMTTELGFDVRYNTAYFANGYVPDLGVFYNQRIRKLGNYPYVDVFLNVKVKRMRFFFKFEHVNSDLLDRTYYTVLHYPMNSRMLFFGLSWNFYD